MVSNNNIETSMCNSLPKTQGIPKEPPHPNEDLQDPFEPSSPSLLVTSATVDDSRARVLIDDGAEINYISESFRNEHKIC